MQGIRLFSSPPAQILRIRIIPIESGQMGVFRQPPGDFYTDTTLHFVCIMRKGEHRYMTINLELGQFVGV
jgi:hypothetical protein